MDKGGVRDLRRALLRSRATMEAVAGLMGSGMGGVEGAGAGETSDSEEARAKVRSVCTRACN